MPTDLPPDYKPKPANDPSSPADPAVPGSDAAYPPAQGDDARDPAPSPAPGDDVVDPPEWKAPLIPGVAGGDVPAPAGVPTF